MKAYGAFGRLPNGSYDCADGVTFAAPGHKVRCRSKSGNIRSYFRGFGACRNKAQKRRYFKRLERIAGKEQIKKEL